MTNIRAIVAVDTGGVIGQAGRLPWAQPVNDARIFVEATSGPDWIVCGRRTWDALPKRARLRMSARAVCLGHGPEDAPLDEIRAVLSTRARGAVVIGGAATYAALADLIDIWQVTSIPGFHKGDARLPSPLPWSGWQLADSQRYADCLHSSWQRDVTLYQDPRTGAWWRSCLSWWEAVDPDGQPLPDPYTHARLGIDPRGWASKRVRMP